MSDDSSTTGGGPSPPGMVRAPPLSGGDLRAWREKLGLSQRQAADALGVSPRSWWGWEHDEYPVPDTIAAIADLTVQLRVQLGLDPMPQSVFNRRADYAVGKAVPPFYIHPSPHHATE